MDQVLNLRTLNKIKLKLMMLLAIVGGHNEAAGTTVNIFIQSVGIILTSLKVNGLAGF